MGVGMEVGMDVREGSGEAGGKGLMKEVGK